MKIILLFTSLFLLLSTTSVLAKPSVNQQEGCDPTGQWKNHGEYVSCVAHQKPGGQAVSEAARSEVGKVAPSPSISPMPTPSATPSLTPVPSASPTPSASPSNSPTPQPSTTPLPSESPTPTPSPSPTATASAALTTTETQNVGKEISTIIEFLNQLLSSLKNLL